MNSYSIKDLEKLSGIKAHTIRIWEQRYKLIKPNRTQSNVRYYDETQLKRLLDIAFLNKHGYKISKIAGFCDHCINHVLSTLSVDENDIPQPDDLMVIMVTMNEDKFHRIIDAKIREIGFTRTMTGEIMPFLDKLNFLRLTGKINNAHENFIINLIRHKIVSVTDRLRKKKLEKPKFLLYLPEGETHDLLLLFVQYLIRSRGYRTYFLGDKTSLNDVILACKTIKPEFIYTILSEKFSGTSVNNYADELLKHCPHSTLLLSGYQTSFLNGQNKLRIKLLNTAAETTAFFESLNKINNQKQQ